jgi:hypothetical protein
LTRLVPASIISWPPRPLFSLRGPQQFSPSGYCYTSAPVLGVPSDARVGHADSLTDNGDSKQLSYMVRWCERSLETIASL